MMRARLLDSCVELLAEKGYAGTTTTLVSERAGVSRGAQLHHFPSKNDLVVAAVKHVTVTRSDAFDEAASQIDSRLPAGASRSRAVLQVLADHMSSEPFMAALELWVAARTDPSLLESIGPLEREIGRSMHNATVELLGVDESVPGTRELVQATLDLVRGLALADIVSDDSRRRAGILDRWAGVLDDQLPLPGKATR